MKITRAGWLYAATVGQFKRHLPLILAGLCSTAFLFAPASARAQTVVTTTADSGPGSLRAAATNVPSGGTISFAANLSGQTILLTSGEILLGVTNKLTTITIVASALTNGISIDGNHASRIFDMQNTTLVLNSLTLTNGYQTYGGAIYLSGVNSGSCSLTLNKCRLVNNAASQSAGAVAADLRCSVTMNATTVSGNTGASDSAILIQDANLLVSNCTFSANGNIGQPGSTLHYIGDSLGQFYSLSVVNSTFTGNITSAGSVIQAEGSGYGGWATFSVVNSTFTGNVATSGSVIFADASNPNSTVVGSITNCTVVSNTVVNAGQPGAVATYLPSGGASGSALTLYNSIVSGNTSGGVGSDLGGTFAPAPNSAHNLIGVGTGLVNGVSNNLVGITNPVLAALGNYGGPTRTMPPMLGSPAIDAGGPVSFTTDQRGFPRLYGSAVDIGAVESQIIAVTTNADSGAGSLRAAVASVAPGGMIAFATNLSGQTITLTNGAIVLTNNSVTIDASMLTNGVSISGNAHNRIFVVNSGSVVMNSLTLTNGKAPGGFGGAIVNSGTLAMNNCTLSASTGSGGGAISNNGVCTLQNSTFYGNSATAGNGGAIVNAASATLNLLQCTLSGNSSAGNGGGIDNLLGQVSVANTIVAGNTGGDITNGSGSTITFGGSNIVQVLGNAGMVQGASTILAVNPQLGPLANNGGSTLTLLPLNGSPAVNAGVNSAAAGLTTDQRGLPRLSDGTVDIGAVELQFPSVATLPASGVNTNGATLNGTVNPSGAATIAYFRYGLTTNYGGFSATNSLPATDVTLSVSNVISGLTPGTNYYYQLVASNNAGTAFGAQSTVTIPPFINIHTFTGAEPGQGLDLQGSFLYAVNVGGNGAPGLIGDANFTADNAPGVTISTPGGTTNTINNWASPNFGTTTNGLRLAQVMSSIRWTSVPGIFTVNLSGLQVGAIYQLQLLFIETYDDRVFNVSVNGTTIVPNFRLLDYGPFGTPIVIPYAFAATSTNALIQLGGGSGGNDNNPQISGFTLETLPPASPVISGVTRAGTNLIFTATNGVPAGGWTLLTTTNLTPPVIWSTNLTGTFDGQGNMTLTNGILSTESARYFIIRTP